MAVAVRDRTNPINSTAMRLEPLGARSPLLDLSDAAVKALICGATDWPPAQLALSINLGFNR
jgi:hypothetical protein